MVRSYYERPGDSPEPARPFPFPSPQRAATHIPLERLAFSPGRRRKLSQRSIQTLAARIQAGTRIESLVVVPAENGRYCVVAGERRLAALQLLLNQGKIGAAYLVACRLIDAKPADASPVLAEEATTSYAAEHEKRQRFQDLRKFCPGLITGAELAIRELST